MRDVIAPKNLTAPQLTPHQLPARYSSPRSNHPQPNYSKSLLRPAPMSYRRKAYVAPDHTAAPSAADRHYALEDHPAIPSRLPKHLRLAGPSKTPSPASSSSSTPPLFASSSSSRSSGSHTSSQADPVSSPLRHLTTQRGRRFHPYPRFPFYDLTKMPPPAHKRRPPPPTHQPRRSPPPPYTEFSPYPTPAAGTSAHPYVDPMTVSGPHPRRHARSTSSSATGSTRAAADRSTRGSAPSDSHSDSRRPPPTPPTPSHPTQGDDRGAERHRDTDAGHASTPPDGDDGSHPGGDGGGGDDSADDDEPDYEGIGDEYAAAWLLPSLQNSGAASKHRQHDLTQSFNIILAHFRDRCAPCAVRGLPREHHPDTCPEAIGVSDKDEAYALWRNKAFYLEPGKWCTFCLMALGSGGGWHAKKFGRDCPNTQILKPALWTLLTNPQPAPHLSTSELIPAHLFLDPTPGLFALCHWLETPVAAHRGILNMHVVALWVFDRMNVHPIPASCRPLVTELVLRARAAPPPPLP
ncbi:hypothetical protein B0H15DRAFT_803280 [Mycena belliarum]|uniref:Uncharacterized protein n=1 Tax=Mycena belliarum TaxID=1033014 RepID=A0AAD6TX14_9AGAR|nr:hypothetical protein B0H15DRAFT_803280 [Mycena belliae]